jgi:hypothetical protein
MIGSSDSSSSLVCRRNSAPSGPRPALRPRFLGTLASGLGMEELRGPGEVARGDNCRSGSQQGLGQAPGHLKGKKDELG